MKFKATFNKDDLSVFNFIMGMRFDGFTFNGIEEDGKMEVILVYNRNDDNVGYVSEVQETLMEEIDSIQIVDYVGGEI